MNLRGRRVAISVLCGVGLVSAFALAACGGGESTEGSTIKIGVLNPTTGSQTQNGTDVNAGLKLYFDSIGNEVAGHPIELIFEDDASNPQQGLERARKLIDQDQVDLLMGVVHSGVSIGVADYAAKREVPYICTCAGANVLTGPDRSPYFFRTAESNAQRNIVLGWYAAEKLGYETATVFAWDFVAGTEHAGAFKKAFEDAGGKVVSEIYTPLPTNDFGPYLSTVKKGAQDCIYAFYASSDAIAFVQELRQFGLTPKTPVIEQGSLTEDEVIPQMGDDALGITGTTCYTWSLNNEVNNALCDQYDPTGAKHPGWYVYQGYLGAMVAKTAIETVGGDLSDKQAFLDAIQNVSIDGPGGPFKFDDRGQCILNQYIVKVEKNSNGELYHKVYDTFESVSQSWTPPTD